jgi:hypothetical protein
VDCFGVSASARLFRGSAKRFCTTYGDANVWAERGH